MICISLILDQNALTCTSLILDWTVLTCISLILDWNVSLLCVCMHIRDLKRGSKERRERFKKQSDIGYICWGENASIPFGFFLSLHGLPFIFLIFYTCSILVCFYSWDGSDPSACVWFRKPRGLPRWKLGPKLLMPQWMNGFRCVIDRESLLLHSLKFSFAASNHLVYFIYLVYYLLNTLWSIWLWASVSTVYGHGFVQLISSSSFFPSCFPSYLHFNMTEWSICCLVGRYHWDSD